MLRIYPVTLEMVREVRRFLPMIEAQDADLARQLKRAATSVPLNVSEGMYSRGKNSTARYHSAMGSAREVLSCFEVAEAMGYINNIDDVFISQVNRIIGTLFRLVHH